jgi:hypothetical protein
VNIFQIRHFNGNFPATLTSFLANPQILKVGRNVTGDLNRLARESGAGPFSGGIELARLAKDLRAIKDARIGLAELCAQILGLKLEKPPDLQISDEWDFTQLSERQMAYAALDALVSLRIYERLSQIQGPGKISDTALPGTTVELHHTDDQIIALGIISGQNTALPNSLNLTKTRVRITVTKVLIPAALIKVNSEEGSKSLSSFGPVPFDIVYQRSRVFTHLKDDHPIPDTQAATDKAFEESSSEIETAIRNDPEFQEFLARSDDDAEGLEWIDEPRDSDSPNEGEGCSPDDIDQAALAEGFKLLNDPEFSNWSPVIRSRVIMDIWHAMARIKVSKEHGLRRVFGIALRDAILIPNAEDKQRIENVLALQGTSWNDRLRSNPRWLWRRCRRSVPPPKELYEAVSEVFYAYGPLKDSKTKLPLFNPQAWKDARNILKAIHLGLLSDPPGVQLYFQIGVDTKNGNLPLLRGGRGTNNPEGGVHHSMRARMPKSGVSVRHASARVKDYVFIHNLVVGTLNRTGTPYCGHYNVEVLDRLQLLLEETRHLVPKSPILKGWINSNLYLPAGETIGILPLPEKTRFEAGILDHNEIIDAKFTHSYLAKQQGTKYAVITVHSVAEKFHFAELMRTLPAFVNTTSPNWKQGSKDWNGAADGKTIFYKVC